MLVVTVMFLLLLMLLLLHFIFFASALQLKQIHAGGSGVLPLSPEMCEGILQDQDQLKGILQLLQATTTENGTVSGKLWVQTDIGIYPFAFAVLLTLLISAALGLRHDAAEAKQRSEDTLSSYSDYTVARSPLLLSASLGWMEASGGVSLAS